MLIEFKVANYRSIRAEQTLSMVANADKELPQNLISCDHVPGLKGTKLVKAVALYGANASGKSNIVAALRFFAEFVRDSATKLQPGAPTGAQPFKLDPACLTEPSKFEITAVINGIRTLYGIEMTRERVTSEYLVAYPRGRPQVWFERDWAAGKARYTWSKSTEHFKHDAALREKTRENAGFLSAAAQFNLKHAIEVVAWFVNRLSHMDRSSDLGTAAAARTLLNSKGELRNLLIDAVRRADVGVETIELKSGQRGELLRASLLALIGNRTLFSDFNARFDDVLKPEPERDLRQDVEDITSKNAHEFVTPQLMHRGLANQLVALSFYDEESVGTQRYLELLAEMLVASAEGQLFAIDEFDSSLHPLLVIDLLRYFATWAGETLGAQLLFTTHNPLLLDQTLLRRDQIWFTEKDQEGATRLYPLTDFKPRKDESLVKGYLAGRYGGIPFIPEGLKF